MARSYHNMMEIVENAQAVEGLRRGLRQAKEGKTKHACKDFDGIGKKHDIPGS